MVFWPGPWSLQKSSYTVVQTVQFHRQKRIFECMLCITVAFPCWQLELFFLSLLFFSPSAYNCTFLSSCCTVGTVFFRWQVSSLSNHSNMPSIKEFLLICANHILPVCFTFVYDDGSQTFSAHTPFPVVRTISPKTPLNLKGSENENNLPCFAIAPHPLGGAIPHLRNHCSMFSLVDLRFWPGDTVTPGGVLLLPGF